MTRSVSCLQFHTFFNHIKFTLRKWRCEKPTVSFDISPVWWPCPCVCVCVCVWSILLGN